MNCGVAGNGSAIATTGTSLAKELQSDLRHLLEEHLRIHQPALLGRLETVAIDDTACTEEQLLAIARTHFGNARHRQPLKIPGQEWREP